MSYANVVRGRLKLKGKALDVKSGSLKKKRKRSTDEGFLLLEEQQQQQQQTFSEEGLELALAAEDGGSEKTGQVKEKGERQLTVLEDHRTAAEKRYDEQKAKLEARRLAKTASKSHRQKVEEFNQYLANLSEHYDIPKVGPG